MKSLVLTVMACLGAVVSFTVINYAQSDELRYVRPEEVKWSSHPALPPGALISVLYGDMTKAGEYVTRVRVPRGIRVMPHTHPEGRFYTVISGTFYLGIGDKFDEATLQAYSQGSVIYLPGGLSHFQYSKSAEYVIQINAIGPTATVYVNPADDPRHPQ
ncbi:MAG: cupin domain-containing protein [Candidatus Acidiferrales bacterium]